MRNVLIALALSSLFAAAPAFAAHKNVAKPAKTSAVSGDAKEGGEAKAEAPADKTAKKPKVKKSKTTKTEKAETPPAEAPAK